MHINCISPLGFNRNWLKSISALDFMCISRHIHLFFLHFVVIRCTFKAFQGYLNLLFIFLCVTDFL